LWREDVSINFNKLRGGERGLEVKICEVNRTKESVRRDNRVEKDVDTGERGNKG
jgi:hypothetical protein